METKKLENTENCDVFDFLKEKIEYNITKEDLTKQCKIYFLTKNNQVVYVGQTTQPLKNRIKQHEKNKDFDNIYTITIERQYLDAIEQKYIKLFKPKYNIVHNNIIKKQFINGKKRNWRIDDKRYELKNT